MTKLVKPTYQHEISMDELLTKNLQDPEFKQEYELAKIELDHELQVAYNRCQHNRGKFGDRHWTLI